MNYKKLTASLALLLLVYLTPKAQNGNYELRNVIPPSPTVASLGKYGEMPVSLYTGIPNISIPLYEIKDGPISLPISLSYHAGGIRVEEIASNVGLGWTLNAGGIIGRQVRGSMDETDWIISDPTQRIDYVLQNGSYSQMNSILQQMDGGMRDSEADIYYYNFNGQSGKFFFDQAGNLYNYPAKNVSVSTLGGGYFGFGSGWQIITEDGTVYEFEKYERVVSTRGLSESESYTAWYLTKIKSADGKRQISFTYEALTYGTQLFLGETRYYDIPGSWGSCLTGGETWGSNTFYTHRLKRIDFSEGYVKFNYSSTDRQDLLGDNSLNQIEIYTKTNSLIKKYDLTYSYFNAGSANEDEKRLKLSSLTEKTSTAQKPPHVFTYEESIQLPHRNSISKDYWGFYNAQPNTNSIPTFTFTYNGTTQTYTGGANRSSNPLTMQACILKKIQYPTGGETEFTYETNITSNGNIPAQSGVRYVGGLRIKQMEDKPGNGGQSVIKKYRYDSEGLLITVPSYGYQLEVHRSEPGNSGCFSPEYQYCNYVVQQSFTNYPLATTQGSVVGYTNVIEDLGDNGEVQHYFSVFGNPGGTFPFPPVDMFEWQRGSELNTKYYVKKNGQLVLSKELEYYYTAIPKGTIYGYKMGKQVIYVGNCTGNSSTSFPPYVRYNVSTEFYALGGTAERLYDQSDPSKYLETKTDYTYNTNHYQLTQIRTRTSSSDGVVKDEVVANKKYPQDYTFTGTPSGTEALGIKKLKDLHIVNVPVEQYTVRQKRNSSTNALSDQRVVGGTITTFKWDNPYPDQVYRLETSAGIPLSTYGTGSGLNSNTFIKNANSTVSDTYKSAVVFNSYDSYGNLTMQHKANDMQTSYLWGYGGAYPVAQVVGASYSTISALVTQSVLDNPSSDQALRNELHKVRAGLASTSAIVTTYTYKPLIGSTSVTDPNNRTSLYDYDGFGRLELIRDQDNNIVKKYCYNYAGQTENCTGSFISIAKNGSFTRNNCPSGAVGGAATYTVATGKYSSSISQADADQKAQDDVTNNGQGYANANAPCTWYSVTKSSSFTRNNCTSGATPSIVTYTVAAGTYSSTTSQAAADALAQNDVNTNGQEYANANASCNWLNTQKSGTFTKNNCPSGYTGTTVTFTVPAGTYWSTISQADADQQAQNTINTGGQSYANSNGTCTGSAPQITVNISNWTGNTYYLTFYNTITNQPYYVTANPWEWQTPTLPAGTYNVTVNNDGYAYTTLLNVIAYTTYGTSAYFENVYIGGTYNDVTFGD
jgi:YD repeat-containing protein